MIKYIVSKNSVDKLDMQNKPKKKKTRKAEPQYKPKPYTKINLILIQ